ncbi:MAG TPA: DUF262 domain-containing HNH endonuclease family protein [Candidatus Acidoferrum sp.]|nr:DUF262 domain-containing HNH endonuclease family protein [Candidatus Acidoferrum sp.]
MPFRLEAHEQPLLKIFSSDFDFSIPLYQRPYAWTVEEAGTLLTDLLDNMGMDSSSVDDTNPYFLGSIVLVKGETPPSDVVDGQQRLATLTTLLSVLRHFVGVDEAEGLTALLYEKANPILGTQNRYRLTLRQQDADFFRTYIQSFDGIGKLKGLKAVTLTDSQRNLRDNALLYWKTLNDLRDDKRTRLAQFVARRCYLVVVATPDFGSAYKIFTVLNSRGLDLSPSDILKAKVIGGIPSENQKSFSQKWEDLEDDLGREGFQELFAHIRMNYRRTKLKETIVEEYEKHILPRTKPASFVDSVLLPFGDAYQVVKKVSYQSAHRPEEVNDLLRWLNKIDNVDWIPPALFYLNQHDKDSDDLVQFFKDLERLAAGQMILRSNVNERINRYAELLTAIEKDKDLYAGDSPLQLTPNEKKDVMTTLDGNLYLQAKIRQFVLLRLDSTLAKGEAIYNYSTITVEHVLPQTPQPGSIWMKWFPTEQLRETWTHRIGNLVLLSRPKNSEAQNFDFDVKKQKYFTSAKGVANFALTTQVLAETEWTPEVVDKRQKAALVHMKHLWRLS